MEIYTVRPGETPSSVARRFGRRTEELISLNQLEDPVRLTAGLPLVIPGETLPGRSLEVSAVAPAAAPGALWEALLPGLSFACPFCRRVAGGVLLPGEDGAGRLVREAARFGTAVLLTAANLDEAGGWSAAAAHEALAQDAARRRLLESVLLALEESGCAGLYLSFCGLYPFDRENYNEFLRLAAPALHSAGRYLVTALAPAGEGERESLLCAGHDYAVHGALADRVTLLAYDWGHALSPPMAVSPLDRVRALLDDALQEIPAGKLWLALGQSGYDWALPWRIGDRAAPLPNARAAPLAVAARAEVRRDALSQCSSFLYADPEGRRHIVWYDGPESLLARLRLTEEAGLAGVSLICSARLWRPGQALLRSCFAAEKPL